MKLFKLVGILFVFVATIAGVIYISDLFKDDEEIDFPETDKVDINAIRTEITNQWEKAKTWDATLHQKQHDKVLRYKTNRMLSKASYDALLNIIRETVVNKVCHDYDVALKASPFNQAKITSAYSNVTKAKKAEGLDTIATPDHRIARVETIHQFYKEVKKFAESNHYLTAKLDTTKLKWGSSFDNKKNAILKKAQNYQNNKLYNEIGHIDFIAIGLAEKEITKKVESHRDAFYNKLYKEIINYFNTAEISRFNLNRLNIVRKDFHNEAPHRYRENLMSYLDEYESNLLKQEESANK